jgi:hypothetical protein
MKFPGISKMKSNRMRGMFAAAPRVRKPAARITLPAAPIIGSGTPPTSPAAPTPGGIFGGGFPSYVPAPGQQGASYVPAAPKISVTATRIPQIKALAPGDVQNVVPDSDGEG